MGLYERLSGRTDALLRKYGKPRKVTHIVVGAYNPDTGNTARTESTATVNIATFPYEIRFINNTTIKGTDLWGIFSAKGLNFVPQNGDKLDMDGKVFTFGPVRPLQPGGVTVYYECHLTDG